MHRRVLATLLLLSPLSLSPLGCGNPTADACEGWKQSLIDLECVPDDFDVAVDCTDFNDHGCDDSPYFECLEGSYSCTDDGQFQSDTTACAALRAC